MHIVEAPYLTTKIRPPRPARGVIHRPRLDTFLELVRSRRLTVIKAPPGFGKTTLALSWADALAGEGDRVVWLSLGPEDDDDERFLRYLGAALRRACEAMVVAGPDWMVGDLSVPIEHRVGWLIEALASQSDEIFVFIDDYHEISRSSIHLAVSLLLRRAPENLHLILLGRVAAPIDLAWLRAHDGVVEIDGGMLRFDLGETQQLLRKGHPGPIVPAEASALHALTGGWIAALRTALLTLRMQGSPAPYLQRTPALLRPIHLLFADLMEQLPVDTVDFMERISITERQCAELAEHLTGTANAQPMLEQLDQQQLFFGPQDGEGGWFAFHPLFREYLQGRVSERTQVQTRAMHRGAAHWFAKQQLWTEAIHHALAAEDVAQALRWIEAHAMSIVAAGDLLTLLAWERQLRSHLVQSPLRLRLAFAWALSLAMACDKALALLDGVEAELDEQGSDDTELLRGECQALRSVLVATTGDYELAARLALECDATPVRQPWVPNAVRNVIAGAHLHTGRWDLLYAVPPIAEDLRVERVRDRISLAYRLSIRGLAEYRQGHLDDAASLLEQAMAVGMSAGARGDVLVALPAPTLALVRYEQDRIREAESINAAHMELNKRVGPMEAVFASYQVAARIARLDGHPSKARNLLDEGEGIGVTRRWRRVEVAILLDKVLFCLLDNRPAQAAACVERIHSLAAAAAGKPDLECIDFGHAAALAAAWRDLFEGRFERAAKSLAAQRDTAEHSGRLLDEIRFTTALALAMQGLGEKRVAVAVFSRACKRAHSVGSLRSILDQPLSVDELIAATRADRALIAAQPWLAGFLASLGKATREANRPRPAISALETLSPRERNILKLMADGLSNKEIARALGITPETVKTHVKKILAKLGAQNRAQAAAMAGES